MIIKCSITNLDNGQISNNCCINISDPTVDILYHTEKYPGLLKAEKHGNFIDLRAAEDCNLKKGEFKLIPLGVSMKLPEGYWAEVVPRSSTYYKYFIIQTNSFGVIDTKYCGQDDEWFMPVVATQDTVIHKNDRICQFRIVNDIDFILNEVDHLDGENRGGHGSTGV